MRPHYGEVSGMRELKRQENMAHNVHLRQDRATRFCLAENLSFAKSYDDRPLSGASPFARNIDESGKSKGHDDRAKRNQYNGKSWQSHGVVYCGEQVLGMLIGSGSG